MAVPITPATVATRAADASATAVRLRATNFLARYAKVSGRQVDDIEPGDSVTV